VTVYSHQRIPLLILVLGAALLASAPADTQKSRARKPNIIFFLADDLGYGEVGCYGQSKIKTPHIDRLASGGVRFTQCYSGNTVCAPSRCVLLTGKHTGHSFIRNNGELPTEGQRPIPPDTMTIGRMLKRIGYTTGVIGKWGLGGPGSSGEPNNQGFDHWFGYLCQRHAHNYYPRYLWRNGKKVMLEGNDRGLTGKQYAPDLMEVEALEFIRRNAGTPFFLYFCTPVPHAAIQVPESSLKEYRGKWEDPPYKRTRGYLPHPAPRAGYAAMVTRMDRTMGRIMALLEALNQDRNTVIFFSSDNGPTFNGGTDSKFFNSTGPLRGLKCSLYEGGIRVPMIVRWPGRIRAGSTSDHVAAFWDVLPTLAHITGAAPPAGIDGISFLPALLGEPGQEDHGHLYWEYASRQAQAVRMGDWKAVHHIKKNRFELYDLKEDVGEKKDVSAAHPEVVRKIKEIMKTGRTPSREFPLVKPVKLHTPNTSLPVLRQAGWKLVRVDSESRFNGKRGRCAFDGKSNTWWHSRWKNVKPALPHEIVIDLGAICAVQGFCYLPRTDRGGGGMIKDYDFSVGNDPGRFGPPAAAGRFTPGKKEKVVTFPPVKGRYVRLRGLSSQNGQPHTSVAELNVLGKVVPSTAVRTPKAGHFQSRWPDTARRTWIGPEYWANRLHDWQVAAGRLECVADRWLPMRTVHLLTHRLAEGPGAFEASVRTGLINEGGGCAGFLVGVGGVEMDYRAAAVVHAFPGRGAGLFAGVNAGGEAFFLDFEKVAVWPPSPKAAVGRDRPAEIVLRLEAAHAGETCTLTLVAATPTGETLSEATLEAPASRLVGNIALVSHPGRQSRGAPGGRFWFRDWTVGGTKIASAPSRALGPVLSTQYTLSRGVLKMTAQLMPIDDGGCTTARLEIRQGGAWKAAAASPVIIPGFTAAFRVENWDATRDTPYRVTCGLNTGKKETRSWRGVIRKDPADKNTIVVAGFTGNHNNSHNIGGGWGSSKKGKLSDWKTGMWFPHADVTRHVGKHGVDVLFFSGDQVYEGKSPTFADIANIKMDYLYKWYLWCWAYRNLTRDIPAVTIPDDHDVYQGNLWGEGGRKTDRDNKGGYVRPADFVKMVERTQTSHLPDPVDPVPIDQGIGVYFTDMVYGRIGFAILEDRKFKSGCQGRIAGKNRGRPDHINDAKFDIKQADVPGLKLLGDRQLKFLRTFAGDWPGQDMKMALSQTVFANVATHHGQGLFRLRADLDSNGWPQSGRNRALAELRRGFAFHLCGDQHLASLVHHGIDAHGDAPWSFCVPSVANFYPRGWNPGTGSGMGDHLDGFGNRVTVVAVTNPTKMTGVSTGRHPLGLHDRMPGYGIVRIDKGARTITVECWPRYADPENPETGTQYPGWPRTIHQRDNYGRKAVAHLPALECTGMTDPVVRVIEEATGELVYALRIKGTRFRPGVFSPGRYTLEVGEPGTPKVRVFKGIEPLLPGREKTLTVEF